MVFRVWAVVAVCIALTVAPVWAKKETFHYTSSGVKYLELARGEGPKATPGRQVAIHFTGWLEDGTKFDSSLDRGQPFVFPLSSAMVIKGLDDGVVGMRVGGKRRLIIPPRLGYGKGGRGGIPGDATLIFEVQLLGVR